MRLVVTGGAGYVGSVCTQVLLERGHEVTVIDDLSTGNREAVPAGATFVEGDVATVARPLLADGDFDGVLHFAAKSLVGESVSHPHNYWQGNVVTTLTLLDAMLAAGGRLAGRSSAPDWWTLASPDNHGIDIAATATPAGWDIWRIPIASPRLRGGNQPTTTRPRSRCSSGPGTSRAGACSTPSPSWTPGN